MTDQRVRMNIEAHEGYTADQVMDKSITLDALATAVAAAIDEHGPDALICLNDGQRYGAQWGYISQWSDIFVAVKGEDDDDEA